MPDCQETIEEFDDDLEYSSITRLADEMEGAKKVTIKMQMRDSLLSVCVAGTEGR